MRADDPNHGPARQAFADARASSLLTHNYVVLETTALVQRRLGPAAVRELHEDLLAPVALVSVDEATHRAAVTSLLAAARRKVSLVDWVTVEVMRRSAIDRVLAFDRDFGALGFEVVP